MSARVRVIIFVLVGIGVIAVGIIAAVYMFRFANVETVLAEPTPVPVVMSPAVVLTHDMFIGDLIGPQDVTQIEVPAEIVPRDAALMENAVGKYVKTDLVQGEILLDHNLADPTNVNHDLAFILDDDHVLMAFPATDLMSGEDVIQRGDIIDIFVSLTQEVEQIGTEGTQQEGQQQQQQKETIPYVFTFDAMQKVGVTALVMEVLYDSGTPQIDEEGNEIPPPNTPRRDYIIRAYLLALDPQDALLLKHLIDTAGIFDIVLRSPTSTEQFDLTPVTQEYIVELYGLEIIP